MKRQVLLGAALTAFGFAAMGCSSSSNSSGTGGTNAATGGTSSAGATGGTTSAGATGGATGTVAPHTGGTTGAGTTAAATGGATAGGSSGCGTVDGVFSQTTTFATALAPWVANKWSPATGTPITASLELTTTAPSGIDCSAGCAHLTADFADGMLAYGGAAMDQYFGATATDTENLLNETITVNLAVVVTGAATAPVAVDLDGLDTFATTNYYDNLWVHNLGSLSALSTMAPLPYKVVDVGVPTWGVLRTVCGSALHTLRIVVSNSAPIDTTNAAKVEVYVQSITIAP